VRHFLADFSVFDKTYPNTYPRLIVRGEGAYLWDVEGRRLLDAGGHLGACQVGHGRREIVERIARQAEQLDFVALDSGLSHPTAVDLAEVLARLAPVEDPLISFTSTGSEANDLAFKIARAYHSRRGEPERTAIFSRDGSYHGSTLAGMAATGAPAFRAGFGPVPPKFAHVAQPSPGRCGHCTPIDGCNLRCADALEAAIEHAGSHTVAAVIAEPVAILQAVKVPHPEYWSRVQSICREAGALLILDEVVTGFGRTGKMFGAEHWNIEPDIMTVAKGVTSGYVPLGAVLTSRRVEDAFADVPLLHLNTYAGHPIACAAALANLDILQREGLPQRAAALESGLLGCLEQVAARNPRIVRVSAIGLLSSIEACAEGIADVEAAIVGLRHMIYENGVIARCSQDRGVITVVFYPTLVIAEEAVESGVREVGDALASAFG
jgi:adenosylmethionine-8-amino-7-oxononanoate aminotransferase